MFDTINDKEDFFNPEAEWVSASTTNSSLLPESPYDFDCSQPQFFRLFNLQVNAVITNGPTVEYSWGTIQSVTFCNLSSHGRGAR